MGQKRDIADLDVQENERDEPKQKILKVAARTVGDTTTGISSHSLRGGGATALYSKGYTREQIMFLGRWRSDSWLVYAKMTKENLGNVAKDLATAHYTVVGQGHTRGREEREGSSLKSNARPGSEEPKAWWDPLDNVTFILIHTEFDKKESCLLANYTTWETWSSIAAESRRLTPGQRLRKLLREGKRVYTGYPREVETWLEVTQVYPSLGGIKFIGPLSLEHLAKFQTGEGQQIQSQVVI
jgi:hypothetical protein